MQNAIPTLIPILNDMTEAHQALLECYVSNGNRWFEADPRFVDVLVGGKSRNSDVRFPTSIMTNKMTYSRNREQNFKEVWRRRRVNAILRPPDLILNAYSCPRFALLLAAGGKVMGIGLAIQNQRSQERERYRTILWKPEAERYVVNKVTYQYDRPKIEGTVWSGAFPVMDDPPERLIGEVYQTTLLITPAEAALSSSLVFPSEKAAWMWGMGGHIGRCQLEQCY